MAQRNDNLKMSRDGDIVFKELAEFGGTFHNSQSQEGRVPEWLLHALKKRPKLSKRKKPKAGKPVSVEEMRVIHTERKAFKSF